MVMLVLVAASSTPFKGRVLYTAVDILIHGLESGLESGQWATAYDISRAKLPRAGGSAKRGVTKLNKGRRMDSRGKYPSTKHGRWVYCLDTGSWRSFCDCFRGLHPTTRSGATHQADKARSTSERRRLVKEPDAKYPLLAV